MSQTIVLFARLRMGLPEGDPSSVLDFPVQGRGDQLSLMIPIGTLDGGSTPEVVGAASRIPHHCHRYAKMLGPGGPAIEQAARDMGILATIDGMGGDAFGDEFLRGAPALELARARILQAPRESVEPFGQRFALSCRQALSSMARELGRSVHLFSEPLAAVAWIGFDSSPQPTASDESWREAMQGSRVLFEARELARAAGQGARPPRPRAL